MRRGLALAACAALAVAAPATAQTDSFVSGGVQVEFPPPGARSLALGGAFVAVADDATASVANPAGLTALVKPEVAVEGRFWNFSALSPLRGRYTGVPTNVGYDTIPDFIEESSDHDKAGVSFLSVVIPKGRFAFGAYRQEQSRYRASFRSDGIFMFNDGYTGLAGAGQDRLDPYQATYALDVVNYGVSVAYRFAGGLSVGGGLAISDFSIDGETNNYYLGLNPNAIPPEERNKYTALGLGYGPPNFADSNRLSTTTERGDDIGFGLNLGALYRPTGAIWTIGGAVRLGPRFDYEAQADYGPNFNGGAPIDRDSVEFKIPDSYSIGMSVRPTDRLLLASQYDYVRYSQLSENVTDIFGTAEPVYTEFTQGLSNADSHQARFGAEYAVAIAPHLVSLRMGAAYVSDHKLRYEQVGATRYPRLEVLYRPGDSQWHFTPGAGIAFTKFQIDAAFDVADINRTLSLSAVYRF